MNFIIEKKMLIQFLLSILIIINFLSLLITFIYSIIYISRKQKLNISSLINEINVNFKDSPIYSIEIDCENPLILSTWEGTIERCDCLGIYSKKIRKSNF